MELNDLDIALRRLSSKQELYTRYFNYFEGNQPIVYSTHKMREIFKNLNVDFNENWCSVVINSVKDKINLRNIFVDGQDISDLINRNQIYLEADAVHEAALITGESFYIVWPDSDNLSAGYYNDPRNCHIFYDAENPRKKIFAAKWWTEPNELIRVTLYYPDRLEYYISSRKNLLTSSLTSKAFEEYLPIAINPLGEVPVFQFKTSQRKIISDLVNVVAPQDAINKLISDLMVTAEFGAFKQKYIITMSEFENGRLRSSPDEIWQIPDPEAKVGEFSVTELNNFIESINHFIYSIGVVTSIPKHYFLQSGGSPSGESLLAAESPLNARAKDRIDSFRPVWEEVISLMAQIDGVNISSTDVKVVYDEPRTIQPLLEMEVRQAKITSGESLSSVLRDEGKSDEEIANIISTPITITEPVKAKFKFVSP